MAGEWQTLPLSDLTLNFDGRRVPVKEADRKSGPYPYYGASGVVDHVDGYLFDGEYLLIAEDGENLRTRQTPVAFMATGRFWVNNHAHIVQGNERATTRFLHYALAATDISGYLTGSTMPKLTQGNMNRIPVVAPPLPEQKRIAHILGTLDDKIELNRRMNATLEDISRAIFQSWFVEASSGAHRFTVADLAAGGVLQVGDGYRAKNSELGSVGLPFARAGNIDNGFSFESVDHLLPDSVAKAGDKLSRRYDVVFTSKGTVGRFAFVPPSMSPFAYSPQLCYWRSVDHSRLNPFVLYQWMQSREFLDQVDRVKGQTDMAEYVSLRDQRRMEIAIPEPTSQTRVAPQLEALQGRLWGNVAESRTLAALRDTLLPKLLSGEIRVPEAEEAVEETVR